MTSYTINTTDMLVVDGSIYDRADLLIDEVNEELHRCGLVPRAEVRAITFLNFGSVSVAVSARGVPSRTLQYYSKTSDWILHLVNRVNKPAGYRVTQAVALLFNNGLVITSKLEEVPDDWFDIVQTIRMTPEEREKWDADGVKWEAAKVAAMAKRADAAAAA